jgi:hypothetical protein
VRLGRKTGIRRGGRAASRDILLVGLGGRGGPTQLTGGGGGGGGGGGSRGGGGGGGTVASAAGGREAILRTVNMFIV